jgi:hypothetical protein
MADEPRIRRSPLPRACAWILGMMAALWDCVMLPRAKSPMRTCFRVTVPCQGDAFSFKVVVSEIWTRPGRLRALEEAVSIHRTAFEEMVQRRLRDISRHYQSDATEEFERSAIASLSRPAGFSDDSALTCTCSIRAEPDDAVCKKLGEAEFVRLKKDAERREAERQVEHLDRMRARCLGFLKEADKDPLGSLAVQLAVHFGGNPKEIAEVIVKHASERERAAEELRKLCDTASQAYRDKDLFDFANSMDSPLSRLVQHVYGMPETPGGEEATTNGVGPPTAG